MATRRINKPKKPPSVWTEADYRTAGYGTIKLRLTDEIVERLTAAAKATGRTRAQIAEAAIGEYLARLERK